jgi:hypothetical protein
VYYRYACLFTDHSTTIQGIFENDGFGYSRTATPPAADRHKCQREPRGSQNIKCKARLNNANVVSKQKDSNQTGKAPDAAG